MFNPVVLFADDPRYTGGVESGERGDGLVSYRLQVILEERDGVGGQNCFLLEYVASSTFKIRFEMSFSIDCCH
jgi:hypothetical protein